MVYEYLCVLKLLHFPLPPLSALSECAMLAPSTLKLQTDRFFDRDCLMAHQTSNSDARSDHANQPSAIRKYSANSSTPLLGNGPGAPAPAPASGPTTTAPAPPVTSIVAFPTVAMARVAQPKEIELKQPDEASVEIPLTEWKAHTDEGRAEVKRFLKRVDSMQPGSAGFNAFVREFGPKQLNALSEDGLRQIGLGPAMQIELVKLSEQYVPGRLRFTKPCLWIDTEGAKIRRVWIPVLCVLIVLWVGFALLWAHTWVGARNRAGVLLLGLAGMRI